MASDSMQHLIARHASGDGAAGICAPDRALLAVRLDGGPSGRVQPAGGTNCPRYHPNLAVPADRVAAEGDASLSDTATDIEIVTIDGQKIRAAHDLAALLPAAAIARALQAKAGGLLGTEQAGRLWARASAVDRYSAREIGAALRVS